MNTIQKFDTPQDLKEVLDNYRYFYCKKYMTSCDTHFYVGTVVRFSGYKKHDMNNSHSYPLQCWVKEYVEWIELDLALGFGTIRTIYKTLEDFLKHFEPLTESNKGTYESKKEDYYKYEIYGNKDPMSVENRKKNQSWWSKLKQNFI